MTMVQGGFGSLSSYVGEGGDQTYGCVVNRTYISIVVVVLVAILGGWLLAMFSYWMFMLLRLGRHAMPFSKKRKIRSAVSPIPDGLISWMLQATRESTFGQQQKDYGRVNMDVVPEEEHQTRDWNYKVMDDMADTNYARLVRVKGTPAPPVDQVPSPGYVQPGYAAPGGQIHWDTKQNTAYNPVPQGYAP